MRVYFITRFSICDPGFRGFRITADYDEKEYERQLFDKHRLNSKFDTFENITLPSIVSQSCDEWNWLIYTSDRMPDEYMKRLRTLTRRYKSIVVVTVKDFAEFFNKTSTYNYERPFATVRIDDDDGVNNRFVEKLQRYANNVGSIVCFTEGSLVRYAKGRVVIGRKVSEKNNAQGLAGIGLDIYSTGGHSDIDTRYNVINDASPDMFVLTCSAFTDTNRGFTALAQVLMKVRRLIFLSFHRPREVPRECAAFIQKRLRR